MPSTLKHEVKKDIYVIKATTTLATPNPKRLLWVWISFSDAVFLSMESPKICEA
ncbi:hypothetical protein WG66_002408 [Moniliophthora roreri]|nr:hypothetical protein WG66_002408 [Moniliophthora roreri]